MKALVVAVSLLVAVPSFAAPKSNPVVDQWWLAVHSLAGARSLATAVEAYKIDHQRYPAAKNAEELRASIEPTYIGTAPTTDAWGTPILYRVSDDGRSYVIASAGSDRKFDEDSWTAGFTTSSKDDLVLKSGGFTREWVIQRVCE